MSRPISAQVVLRPAAGGRAEDREVTAAGLGRVLPDPAELARLRARFAERGFEVGEAVGNSFSITAAPATFEAVFARPVEMGEDGAWWRDAAGRRHRELAGEELGLPATGAVLAVAFPEPPEFGPTRFGP